MLTGQGKAPTATEVFGEPGLKQETVARFTIPLDSGRPKVAEQVEPPKEIPRTAAPMKANGAYDISAIFDK